MNPITGRGRFAEGLRKDLAKRLRMALAKLNERVTDAEIERQRHRKAGDEERAEAAMRERLALEGHLDQLRFSLAWFLAYGHLTLSPEDEEALEAADKPRRPARQPTPKKGASGAPATPVMKAADVAPKLSRGDRQLLLGRGTR